MFLLTHEVEGRVEEIEGFDTITEAVEFLRRFALEDEDGTRFRVHCQGRLCLTGELVRRHLVVLDTDGNVELYAA